ncbi:hypothetical protein [Pontibacter cellulosilyticus]|uniref:hypothetical protein n=1 Tax=Pontibacter cellulosilyticus TaxID=1720253 RepID=UPI001E37A533|nr:hypothetical protein [Pontibacter cellulosilyticus]
MKNRFLFPHRFKMIGWILFVPAVILGLLITLLDYAPFEWNATVFAIYDGGLFEANKVMALVENNVFDELVGIAAIVGGLLAAFSKEKDEDEYIAQIRLESLLWATYINYGFLLFSILFIYGSGFYQIMIFNMFTLLFIFLIRFNFILYKSARAVA